MAISEAWLRRLGLGLLVLGCGLVAVGIWRTGIWDHKIWQPDGLRRLIIFLMLAAPTAVAVPLVFRSRWPLGAALMALATLIGLLGIGPVVAVVYLATSCWCLGRLVLGDRSSAWEPLTATALCIVIGFALLSGFLNAAMHFRINTQTLYTLLLGVPILLARRDLRTSWSHLQTCLVDRRPLRLSLAALGLVLSVILAVHLVYVALPERGADALAMHLRICTTVANELRWNFDCATFAPALMPANGDWFYSVGYLLAGEYGAKLVNFLFFLLVLSLIYGETARRTSHGHALLLAALFASAPIAFVENASMFVENVLAAFVLAAFVILSRRLHGLGGREAIALAVLLGAAASTKLHGVIFLGLMAPLAAFACLRQSGFRQAAPTLVRALAIAAVLAVPPYLVAYGVSGNPLFPFYNALFQSPYFPQFNFVDSRWVHKLRLDLVYQLTFHTHKFLEAEDGAFGFHFLALGMGGFLLGCLRRNAQVIFATVLAAAYVLVSSSTIIYLRYLYPVFAIFLLACIELFAVLQARPVARRASMLAAVALVLLNLTFLPTFYLLKPFETQALFSRSERAQLIDREMPWRRLVAAANAHAGARGRVLFIGSPSAAGLEGKARFLNWYDLHLYTRFTSTTDTEGLGQVLQGERITHVISFSGRELPNQAVLDQLLAARAKPILTVSSGTLYALLPATGLTMR